MVLMRSVPRRFVCNAVKSKDSTSRPTGFFELYGQGGLTRAARRYKGLNVQGPEVLDLRTLRPDGQNWDFSRKKDRQWALKILREKKPKWVIAAPPMHGLHQF